MTYDPLPPPGRHRRVPPATAAVLSRLLFFYLPFGRGHQHSSSRQPQYPSAPGTVSVVVASPASAAAAAVDDVLDVVRFRSPVLILLLRVQFFADIGSQQQDP